MESDKDYPSLLNPAVIGSYWVYKCASVNGSNSNVFPQGYSSIVFYFRENTESLSCADSVYPYILIGGEVTRPTPVLYRKDDFLIAAQVKSCYLYSLLKMKMEMLTDRYIPLEEIDRKLARTLKACCNADTPEQKLAAIDKQFARLFEEIPAAVEGISRAVNMIRTSRGLCSLDDVLQTFYVSSRTLERNFLKMVGVTPKTYQRIIRFNNVLHELKLRKNQPLIHTALDFGYYDQAHFINDFKKICGFPPSLFSVR
jgi:AraC-like DNA-binding protein